MFGYLIFLLTIKNCIIFSYSWENSCPEWCVCQTVHWIDTSVTRYMKQPQFQLEPQFASPRQYQNEVLEKISSDDDDLGELVKSATCILQPGTDILKQFNQLYNNLEVLVLLQSKGFGSLELKPEYVISLKKLKVLEVRSASQSEPIIIQGETLSQLKHLEYLILEGASLVGHPSLGNRATPIGVASFIDIANGANNELGPLLGENPELEYLTPSEDDENLERLPYKEYQRRQQIAGLSAFSDMSLLRLLVLENCGIEDLSWDMLNGLIALEHLSLARNQLYYIPELAFYATPKLRTLSLADNQILNVQSTSLVGLLDLERLDLSGNNISHLSELSLPPFPRLKHADLMNNPLEAVFASTFEVMNSTQSLALGSVSSPLHLVPDAFRGLTELLTLRIERLEIPQLIREMFRGMPKLQALRITGNIHKISFDGFFEVRKLITLLLANCQISHLSMDAFYGLELLERLDLSNNLLETLPPGIFQGLISLSELELQNNRLMELAVGTISRLPAKMIRLDGNPWDCTCAMSEWKPLIIVKTRASITNKVTTNDLNIKKKSHIYNTTNDLIRYRYDRRITPLCNSPEKFKGWTVFQAVRKGLRCDREIITNVPVKSTFKEAIKSKYEYFMKKNMLSNNEKDLQNRSIILKNKLNISSLPIKEEIDNEAKISANLKQNYSKQISKDFQNKTITVFPNNDLNSPIINNKQNHINNMILYPENKITKKTPIFNKTPVNTFSNQINSHKEGIDIFSEIRKAMNKENPQRGIDKYKKLKKALHLRNLNEENEKLKMKMNI